MIPSTIFALAAVLSSFATANGAVIQRDGTFTYLTPQPTAPGQVVSTATTTTTSQSSSTTSTQSTTSTTSGGTGTTTTQSSSVTSTRSTTPTSTSTTTQSSSVTSTRSANPTSTSITTQSSSVTSTRSTTPTSTATTPTTTTKSTSVTFPVSTTLTPPSATPTPPAGNVNCNGVQQWQASFAYTAGDQVIFNGQLFTARQWTYNNAPPAHPDQWTFGGTCAQPINNQANCKGVPAWQSTVAYTAGNRVTFNGHLWSAVQWVESNSPGDTSGSWKDLGACA